MNSHITIGWLYPQLMSTYGDRGNVQVLQKRCEWRGITASVLVVDQSTTLAQLQSIDLLFGGGAQDREQELVMQDLRKKGKAIKALIEKEVPALFVCGAPQLMGKYYEPAEGKRIEGLGIFDMVTKHPGKEASRLIGNVVASVIANEVKQSLSQNQITSSQAPRNDMLVGFENHGGRTYLGEGARAFAKVIHGFGNNGEDGTEGVMYKNAIGTYLHGPLLPKNPQIADFLIQKALEIKYQKKISLKQLDDTLEQKANEVIVSR